MGLRIRLGRWEALARKAEAQKALTGQVRQAGLALRQVVAPSSMIASL